MPNLTKNLGLNTWLENEVVDFEEVNANFEKLDTMCMVVESGTKTSSYTGGVSGTTTWRYKKYSDGTLEMSTRLIFNDLKCNGGSKAPYYSGASTVQFPFNFKEVYDCQIHLASNTFGWISDITGRTVSSDVTFRAMAMAYESTSEYKQVYVNVKGVLA